MTEAAAEQERGPSQEQEPEQVRRRLRVAAYGVCVRDGRILLAHNAPQLYEPGWTMPGGGLEHGEDPVDAVVRELEEETGYQVAVERLLGTDSFRGRRTLDSGVTDDFQALRILYAVRVTGGTLRDEVGGSTDRAAWHPLDELPSLQRVELVDLALRLYREQPPAGRLAPAGRQAG